MKAGEAVVWILLVAVVGVTALLLIPALEKKEAEQKQRHRFDGACQVLDGKVHDDVCLKGDTVVLRLNEVK